MAGYNSLGSYSEEDVARIRDAGGITQFPSSTAFAQLMNGLQIQGGLTASIGGAASLVIPFHFPYETQVLGIFIQPLYSAGTYGSVDPAATTLAQFKIINGPNACPFYWWAVGV